MSKIKIFNSTLNNSIKNETTIFNSFRNQVDMILKSAILKTKNCNTVSIIGAGKMEDFSLRFFVKYFEEIIITDVDIDTCKSVVDKLHLTKKERKKISFRQIEYTGFEESKFFYDFKERIINARDFKKIDQIINQKLNDIKDFVFLKDIKDGFDFIYVSPIYTQLIYNQILMECSVLRDKGFPEHLLKYIEGRMLEEMVVIIDRFNLNLVNLLNDNGTLFVLSDVLQVNPGSDFELRIRSGIKSKDVMDDIYESYKDKYGMGLGDYGLYSLDKHLSSGLCRWLIWPFAKETSYVVKLQIYSKKQYFEEVQK